MRAAVSFWSRPIGMHTIGTPWASAFMTVPWPQWVIATEASRRIGPCGADWMTVDVVGRGDVVGREASDRG